MENSNISVMTKVLKKAPIVGFVRYSQKILFGESKTERDMFESKYFEYRFKIFLKVTLKSFQEQTNKNFVVLLLHSENMPENFKARFTELENANSFLQNIFVKDISDSLNEALIKSVENVLFQEDVAITFRIDNDDAVQNDFIQQLSEFRKKEFVGFAINMSNIAVVKRIADASFMVEERYYPSNPIGLAYVTTQGSYKTIMEIGSHDIINEKSPIILLAKNQAMGLLTINGENAINSINNENAKLFNKDEFNAYLKVRKFENLELDCLRVFNETRKPFILALKKASILLIPPIFTVIIKKIKNRISTYKQ